MLLDWKAQKIKPITATFSWNTDYAAEVYFGAYYLNGTRGVARPWAEVTLQQIDLEKTFKESYANDAKTAFIDLCELLDREFKNTIDVYEWGVFGRHQKLFRNLPTWNTITDSGDLRDSQQLTYE